MRCNNVKGSFVDIQLKQEKNSTIVSLFTIIVQMMLEKLNLSQNKITISKNKSPNYKHY